MYLVISVTKHLPRPSATLPGPLNVQVPRTSHLSSKWRGWDGGWCSRGLYPFHSGLVEPWNWGEKQARNGNGLS